ncbi:MAG: hypothetical protein MK132_20220 [Lentisphaerales bacterium]|nr:hypothetical protein [Lentisphaerales bacterium]
MFRLGRKIKGAFTALAIGMLTLGASAQSLVTYDPATKTTTWDASSMATELMKSFTAGTSLLLIFLPLGIGISLIIMYSKKGVKTS